MKKYYKLSKIFYMDGKFEEEYHNRFNSYSTYKTNLKIKSINNGNFEKEETSLFLFASKELMNLNIKIMENSREIEVLRNYLPESAYQSFLYKLLINELQSTNEIETVRSTKKEIVEAIKNTNVNNKRFVGLVKSYMMMDSLKDINEVKDFRKIYDELVSSEVEKENKLDGELFRKEVVNIDSSGKVIHKGASSEDIIVTMLSDLVEFYKYNDMPYIYKIMVFHYFFEYIHPFYDGNGRVGRYLVCKQLSSMLDPLSALTFSYSINRNKSKYYKAFTETSHPLNRGEVTFFVEDMLSFIVDGQESIVEYLEGSISKMNKAATVIVETFDVEIEKRIFISLVEDYLFSPQDGLLSVSDLANRTESSMRTVKKYIELHNDKLEKIKSRPLIYKLKEDFANSLFI